MCVLPDEIEKKVLNWSRQYIKTKYLYTTKTGMGRQEDIHVTCLYGLHTNDVRKINPIIEKFKPFRIKFGKISKFTNDDYDVIKISIESNILRDINRKLKKLPYTSTHAIYQPHCTIAYVETNSCDHLLGKCAFCGLNPLIKNLKFSPSYGNQTIIALE